MTYEEALEAFTRLCNKLCGVIDGLETRVERLEGRQDVAYTQTQVSEITGWSVSAVGKWLETGFIKSVRVNGKKNRCIPPSEVDKILARKGKGKNLRKQ